MLPPPHTHPHTPQLATLTGCKVANDLYTLNPEMRAWVLHVLVFIVPRQILPLGDPARRSCDACESFGAVAKKIIRHLTCRRRASKQVHVHNRQSTAIRKRGVSTQWMSTFTRGYVEQSSFRRVTVRAELIHGVENEPHLQRADARLLDKGRSTTAKLQRDVGPGYSITV